MNPWIALFIGLLLGWLIEYAVDWFFWRRKSTDEAIVAGLQEELAASKERVAELEAQLSGAGVDSEPVPTEFESEVADTGFAEDAPEDDLEESGEPLDGDWAGLAVGVAAGAAVANAGSEPETADSSSEEDADEDVLEESGERPGGELAKLGVAAAVGAAVAAVGSEPETADSSSTEDTAQDVDVLEESGERPGEDLAKLEVAAAAGAAVATAGSESETADSSSTEDTAQDVDVLEESGEWPGGDLAKLGVAAAAGAAVAAAGSKSETADSSSTEDTAQDVDVLEESGERPGGDLAKLGVAAAAGAAVAASEDDEDSSVPEEDFEDETDKEPSEAAAHALEQDAPVESGDEAAALAAVMVTGAAAKTTDLSYVEGIGPVYASKLSEVGVDTPQKLLERGATPKGRRELANESGISGVLILTWVNHVDLYRIKGLGSEYADLLEEAGVDTVPELAQRNPDNLYQRMIETNQEKHLVRHVPSRAQVEDWVNQAKQLPRVVSY